MKISLDISPLSSGHKIRGVGTYVRALKENLPIYDKKNSYTFFNTPSELSKNEDVVHIPYFDPFTKFTFANRESKTFVTIHDLTPLVLASKFPVGIRGKIAWWQNKRILKKIDGVITDSHASKKDIVKLTGISEERVHVVYLAAGEHFRHIKDIRPKTKDLRLKYGLPDQFALYVGDVTANKNLPRLVRAIKEINVTLVLVGKAIANMDYDRAHPWNKDLATIQKEMKGDKRFIPLGFVPEEDLVSLYNIADVFVMPSLYEGFGLPILEAMQSGCPVVTTKEGSLPEVAGDAAHFVDAKDIHSIANGIGEVFFTPLLREKLISNGLAQAKKFTWESTIKKTVIIYEKAI